MKKLLTSLLLVAGSAIAGLVVWRKVEADRTDDLWSQAEKKAAELHAGDPGVRMTQSAQR